MCRRQPGGELPVEGGDLLTKLREAEVEQALRVADMGRERRALDRGTAFRAGHEGRLWEGTKHRKWLNGQNGARVVPKRSGFRKKITSRRSVTARRLQKSDADELALGLRLWLWLDLRLGDVAIVDDLERPARLVFAPLSFPQKVPVLQLGRVAHAALTSSLEH